MRKSERRLLRSTVDSKTLQHGCMMIYAGTPFSLGSEARLSSCYCTVATAPTILPTKVEGPKGSTFLMTAALRLTRYSVSKP